METTHHIFFENSTRMSEVTSGSVHLVVTSPPYPIIEMWDELFSGINPEIRKRLQNFDGRGAFELMHAFLNEIWEEVDRVLVNGGILCINIGDATRKIGKNFELFPNHIKIVDLFSNKGYSFLPGIIWRKQSNKPNKFMGSGMLPPCAYVTMEHEYILIFRKGNNRTFNHGELSRRRKSAFFWEERNIWFSEIWSDLKGVPQELIDSDTRKRSGAFPFELAYRLINMFSIIGDNVLDPFLGTGTTSLAAICTGRNSFGYEIDQQLRETISNRLQTAEMFQKTLISERLQKHSDFITDRISNGKECKYKSKKYGFPVITSQEREILFPVIDRIEIAKDSVVNVTYRCEAS